MSETYTAAEALAALTEGAHDAIRSARQSAAYVRTFTGDGGEGATANGIGQLCDVADKLLIMLGAAQTRADGMAARIAALEAANAR